MGIVCARPDSQIFFIAGHLKKKKKKKLYMGILTSKDPFTLEQFTLAIYWRFSGLF